MLLLVTLAIAGCGKDAPERVSTVYKSDAEWWFVDNTAIRKTQGGAIAVVQRSLMYAAPLRIDARKLGLPEIDERQTTVRFDCIARTYTPIRLRIVYLEKERPVVEDLPEKVDTPTPGGAWDQALEHVCNQATSE